MNVTEKFDLFVMKGAEGDQFRRKIAAVGVAIALILLVAIAIYIAVSASPSVAGVNSLPVSLSDNPELIVTRRSAAAIPLSTNPELLVAQRYAETGSESAFSRTPGELAFANNYGAGEVLLARRYAADKVKIAAESNLSVNPELRIARRSIQPAPLAVFPRTASEVSLANSFGASERILSERYGVAANTQSVFSRTAAEVQFAERYQSSVGQINTALERTPRELDFALHYNSSGQINTASQSTADLDFTAQYYCATEEQLNERYGCK